MHAMVCSVLMLTTGLVPSVGKGRQEQMSKLSGCSVGCLVGTIVVTRIALQPNWRELTLVVDLQIAIAKILADINGKFGKGSPYVYMQI